MNRHRGRFFFTRLSGVLGLLLVIAPGVLLAGAARMEVLRFDSAKPDPVFRRSVDRLRDQLLAATVVATDYEPALPYASSDPVPALDSLPWPAIS